MGIYDDENWQLDENHWILKAASWLGSHYKLVRWTLFFLLLIIGGVIWWNIAKN